MSCSAREGLFSHFPLLEAPRGSRLPSLRETGSGFYAPGSLHRQIFGLERVVPVVPWWSTAPRTPQLVLLNLMGAHGSKTSGTVYTRSTHTRPQPAARTCPKEARRASEYGAFYLRQPVTYPGLAMLLSCCCSAPTPQPPEVMQRHTQTHTFMHTFSLFFG